jgi:hypothetical protein
MDTQWSSEPWLGHSVEASGRIVLECSGCGEELLLLGLEEDCSKEHRDAFECACGKTVTLADRVDGTAYTIKTLLKSRLAPEPGEASWRSRRPNVVSKGDVGHLLLLFAADYGSTVTVAGTDSTGANPPPACAVFVTVPGRVGVATISTATEPPVGITPSVQSKRLPPWWSGPQYPWPGVAETSFILGGKKSLKPTCWGEELFVTTMLKVSGRPTVAGSGAAVWVTLIPSVCAGFCSFVTPSGGAFASSSF